MGVAKEDLTVTDALGVPRKLFAGQTVPNHLVAAYEDATGGPEKAKAEKAPEKNKAEAAPEKDKAEKAPEAAKASGTK